MLPSRSPSPRCRLIGPPLAGARPGLRALCCTCATCEQARRAVVEAPQRWGGADNVGGSPRGIGSRLSPAEVEAVVAQVVAAARAKGA